MYTASASQWMKKLRKEGGKDGRRKRVSSLLPLLMLHLDRAMRHGARKERQRDNSERREKERERER